MFVRIAVVLIVVFAAQRAEACTCADDTRPVLDQLRDAKKRADAVFLARVVSVEHSRSLEPHARPIATLEIVETFKGKPSTTITMLAGNGADCSYPFRAGTRLLVYGYRSKDGVLSTSWCTRTRPIRDASDAEVHWLRTGVQPPKPASVRREVVQCARCDIEAVAAALTGVSEPIDRCCNDDSPDGGVDGALRARTPFWTSGRTDYERRDLELFGVASDGGAFRLAQAPHRSAPDECQQRVTLTWCSRLARGESVNGTPPLGCRQPQVPLVVCDENATRTARTPPVESADVIVGCKWGNIDPLVCALTEEERGHDGGAMYPQLRCVERYGTGGDEPRFRCHMAYDAGTSVTSPSP